MARLKFDVDVDDNASATLARIGSAFKRIARDADNAGRDSGRGFGGGFRRWFDGEGNNLFKGLAHNMGGRFGSALIEAFSSPGYGLQLAGVLAAVIGTVGPGIGATLAGGVVTAFGAGLAGLGIAFAAQSQDVQDRWHVTVQNMGKDMELLSRPFEQTLKDAADVTDRTFASFKPALEKAFIGLAPVVSRFVDQAGHALERLVPVLTPISNAFSRVLDAMGPALNSAIGSIANGLERLSASVEKNPEALADFVSQLGALTGDLLGLFTTLNEIDAKFKDLTGGVSAVDATMGLARGPVVALNAAFAGENEVLAGLHFVLDKTTTGIDANGQSMNDAAFIVTKAAGAYREATGAAGALSNPMQDVADAAARQATQFTSAVAAMQQWADNAISAKEAAINVQQAIDDARQSVKEHGKNLNIDTEAGRANYTALITLARAIGVQTAANDKVGQSQLQVASTAATSRASFVRLATQMGLSKRAAEVLATQLIKIPNVSREARLTANKKDLEAKLAAAKKQLNDKDLTKERRAKINADIKALQLRLAQAQAEINALHGKTVFVTIQTLQKGPGNFEGGINAQGHAGGGLLAGPPSRKDNVIIAAATGEFVVNADQTSKHLPLLRAINEGIDGFAAGGLVGHGGQVTTDIVTVERALVGSLRAMVKAVQSSADKITSLLQKYHELEAATTSSFRGGLFGGDQSGQALSLSQRLQQRAGQANAFRRALQTLKAKGINIGLFQELAESGDVASAIQLSQMGRGGIADINKQYLASQAANRNLGTFAAQTVYGRAIRSEQAVLRRRHELVEDIQKALRSARIELHMHGASHFDEVLINLLRTAIKVRGGNVQAVLGHR